MSGQRHFDVVESVICQLLLGSESVLVGFPGGSAGKESACDAGDPSSIPGSGRSPGERDRLPAPVFFSFRCGSAGKESVWNVGDLDSFPGLGRCPGEGKGYPLQYFGLENSMDCTVHRVAKSQTRLSDFSHSVPHAGAASCASHPVFLFGWRTLSHLHQYFSCLGHGPLGSLQC